LTEATSNASGDCAAVTATAATSAIPTNIARRITLVSP
jgi:hypothetical protein